MNKSYLTELRDKAMETGAPPPACDHYDVTVSNETAHSLVLTSRTVAGTFDDPAPGTGHVLHPDASDTFRITSVHYPWESGAATLRYQMAGVPVGFTAVGGPPGSHASSAMVEGHGCEYYACAIEGRRNGDPLIRLIEAWPPG
ncbi:hypothetical protein [Streptomyces thioluteus]